MARTRPKRSSARRTAAQSSAAPADADAAASRILIDGNDSYDEGSTSASAMGTPVVARAEAPAFPSHPSQRAAASGQRAAAPPYESAGSAAVASPTPSHGTAATRSRRAELTIATAGLTNGRSTRGTPAPGTPGTPLAASAATPTTAAAGRATRASAAQLQQHPPPASLLTTPRAGMPAAAAAAAASLLPGAALWPLTNGAGGAPGSAALGPANGAGN
ncbi:hypothetical protein CXG81DRAFT_29037, partial [Caulochytrium protostelioides]